MEYGPKMKSFFLFPPVKQPMEFPLVLSACVLQWLVCTPCRLFTFISPCFHRLVERKFTQRGPKEHVLLLILLRRGEGSPMLHFFPPFHTLYQCEDSEEKRARKLLHNSQSFSLACMTWSVSCSVSLG